MQRRPHSFPKNKKNDEENHYRSLYEKHKKNPIPFSEAVILELFDKIKFLDELPQEINVIEKVFNPDEGRSIIKSFLNTNYIIGNGFSLALFKTCLDKVCLPAREIDHQSELIQTLMICKNKLFGVAMNDHEDIPQFKEMMIYFLEKTRALMAGSKNDFSRLKYEIFDLLKMPKLDDEVKDAIIKSLNLRSKALISVVKGDNKDLISKIYESPESLNDKNQLNNGALDYAFAVKNKDAIILLYGFTDIKKYTTPELLIAFNEVKADFQPILRFGLEIERKTDESQKFIHTFKNLSDDGKKHLFSKFLEHKKFPNSDSTLTPHELRDFFATFRQDEVAFQNLADLIKEKPENQEFIALINGSDLFYKEFKDDLNFKSQTLAERLIIDFNSLNNNDEKKLFLADILQNKNPESSSTEISRLDDDVVYNFFKIFLRNDKYEELFDEFRNNDKKFEILRDGKNSLIEPIHDEFDLEDFINFLNIFSSSDFKEKSEEIKTQIENFLSNISKEDNILNLKEYILEIYDNEYILEHAFSPENHLALSNLYLNYPEETKEIFTHEKLAILLDSDLQVVQKQKLLIKVLEMDFDESEKLSLIKFALKSTWSKSETFFPNQESDEVKELLDKLNAQQITGIYFSFQDLSSNADVIFLDDYFFNSNRFNYDQKSVFLDHILVNPDLLKRETILEDSDCSIFKHFSITLIKSEFANFASNYDPKAQENLLSTALNSENIKNDQKIDLLTDLLATNDDIKLNLIYDYFLNKNLASAQELLTQEVVGALFATNLDQEKKLDLVKKILGDDGQDVEFKKSFYNYLPEEFRSALNLDPEYVKSEVKLVLSGIIREVETQQRTDFSAIRAESRSPSPDQNSSSPVDDSNASSSFSVIRTRGSNSGSQSPDGQVVSAPSSPDGLVISAGSESPDERRGVPNSPSSITGATIGVGSSGPEISSAIAIVDNVLSAEDCEELQKILTGRVFGGFRDVRSYTSEEFIPDSPLKIFHVNFKNTYPFGNDGLSLSDSKLKKKFHEEQFDKLLKKIHESNKKFDQQRLKSYLYAILAISTGESNSIPNFFECYDHLIKNTRGANTVGPGHGSWIEKPEDYVKLKIIINEMERIHDESSKEGNPAFTETNLHNWMRAQLQDRRIEEFNYLENKEFVENLIKAFDDKALDAKASELKIVEESFKKLLNQNTSFLDKLATFSVSTDENEDKDLANHLLDDLFEKMASKNSSLDKVAKYTYNLQLRDLRENLTTKINEFKERLSTVELSELDTDDDHLILDLILEIPTKFDDILKRKLVGNSFEIEGKIEDFTEKLGTRKSIFAFRKTCASQAEVYANKARELKASPAKSGPTR